MSSLSFIAYRATPRIAFCCVFFLTTTTTTTATNATPLLSSQHLNFTR